MGVPILPVESHAESTGRLDRDKDLIEAGPDVLEGDWLGQCKVEIFREAVISKIAAAQRCAALEGKGLTQGVTGKADEEPRKG
jgi:hypothetical protein